MASISERSPVTPTSGNAALDRDIERLAALCPAVELLVEGAQFGVIAVDCPLRPGHYNLERTAMLLRTDAAYPVSAMDMFWVDQRLTLADGRIPAGGESIEMHFGRPWRRYSWHRNSPWVPGRDDLVGHFEFCVARLLRAE